MSKDLREIIIAAEKDNKHQVVWVTCQGENVADVEHIGPIRYIPEKGFQSQYFPYTNQDGYLSPLIAVHFENPTRKYIIINVSSEE